MSFSLLRSLLSKLYLTTLQQQLSWRETIQERKCEGWKFWDGRLADQLRLGRIGIMIEDYGLTHERRKEIVFCLFVMLVLSEGVSTNAWMDGPMGFADQAKIVLCYGQERTGQIRFSHCS
jgi:hypothetical protein